MLCICLEIERVHRCEQCSEQTMIMIHNIREVDGYASYAVVNNPHNSFLQALHRFQADEANLLSCRTLAACIVGIETELTSKLSPLSSRMFWQK